MKQKIVLALSLVAALAGQAHATDIGEVVTARELFGPNHKIVVEVFDDPRVQGVSCYLSRARTGGMKAAIGMAEDKSEASVACRQVGDIHFNSPLPRQEEVFSERASLVFKHVRVVRMVDPDPKHNALVYMVYSDRFVDGSPKNSITAVPVPTNIRIPLK